MLLSVYVSNARKIAYVESDYQDEAYPYLLRVFELHYRPGYCMEDSNIIAEPHEVAVVPLKNLDKVKKVLQYFGSQWLFTPSLDNACDALRESFNVDFDGYF